MTALMELTAFFKTLSDETCLRMLSMLNHQERDIDELACLLDLSEPVVSHHLSQLRAIGLVNLRQSPDQQHYRLNHATLKDWKRRMQHVEAFDSVAASPSDDTWIDQLDLDAFDRKVLRDYTSNGRLREIPVKAKKEQAVLRWLITAFEPDAKYTEQQVNDILVQYFEDYVQLRRSLINSGFMDRERDGSAYWRVPGGPQW